MHRLSTTGFQGVGIGPVVRRLVFRSCGMTRLMLLLGFGRCGRHFIRRGACAALMAGSNILSELSNRV